MAFQPLREDFVVLMPQSLVLGTHVGKVESCICCLTLKPVELTCMSIYLVNQVLMLLGKALKCCLIDVGDAHFLHASTSRCYLPLCVSPLGFCPIYGMGQLICPLGIFGMNAKSEVEHRGCYLLIPEKKMATLVERKQEVLKEYELIETA
ncbi:hypothetical protein FBY35_7177 [Streptomyces sp. SLBN-118]|nr:hypothetical protein FBY35_7177 [Streptomyces sp. SLBN-118]